MRLIDADALMDEVRSIWKAGILDEYKSVTWKCALADAVILVLNVIARMLPIDAEPVRHGRWEWYEDWGPSNWLEAPDFIAAEWRCSACKTNLADYINTHVPGETVYMDNFENKPTLAYCPNCGAKMDAKEDSHGKADAKS